MRPTIVAQDDLAQQIRRLLLNRVNDRLTICEIAAKFRVSLTHAKKAFRDTYGCGIIAFFNELEDVATKCMLCDPTLTIDQVSRKLGFSSATYFSRTFLQHTGQRPTDFLNKSLEVPEPVEKQGD